MVRRGFRGGATTALRGAVIAALRGVEVVVCGVEASRPKWKGFVAWRHGGSWCGEQRRKKTTNGAKWR